MKPILTSALHASMVDVKFGVASRNCNGIGICHLEAWSPAKSFVRPYKMGIALLEFHGISSLQFHILKSSLLDVTRQLVFERQLFPVPEEVVLPLALCPSHLLHGAAGRLLIKAGDYPIKDDGDCVIVEVEIEPVKGRLLRRGQETREFIRIGAGAPSRAGTL